MRTIPPIVSGHGDLRRRRAPAGDAPCPRRAPAGASARSSCRSGTLDKKQFPNTQIVVKGNLVAVVDPLEYVAIQAASVLAALDEVDRVGRPARERQHSSRRSGRSTGRPRRSPSASTSARSGAALASAAKTVTATYEYPFEKHAPIGPTCAVADVRPDGMVYVYVHSANPQAMRWELATMLNTTIDKVVVRNFDGSGHYGRSNGGSPAPRTRR